MARANLISGQICTFVGCNLDQTSPTPFGELRRVLDVLLRRETAAWPLSSRNQLARLSETGRKDGLSPFRSTSITKIRRASAITPTFPWFSYLALPASGPLTWMGSQSALIVFVSLVLS